MEGNKGTKEWMKGVEVEEMGRRRYWRGGSSQKEIYAYCRLILIRPGAISCAGLFQMRVQYIGYCAVHKQREYLVQYRGNVLYCTEYSRSTVHSYSTVPVKPRFARLDQLNDPRVFFLSLFCARSLVERYNVAIKNPRTMIPRSNATTWNQTSSGDQEKAPSATIRTQTQNKIKAG